MNLFLILLLAVSAVGTPLIGGLIFLAERTPRASRRIFALLKAGVLFLVIPLPVLPGMLLFGTIQPFSAGIFAVWSLGAMFSWIKIMKDIRRFKREVLAYSHPVCDQELLCLADNLRNELQIRSEIPLYCNQAVSSPALVMIRRPVILLNDEKLSRQELYFALKHEMVHLKRKHIFYKRVGTLAGVLHWFNPFVSLFVRFFCEYCELDCDREVLLHEDRQGRLTYARFLFQLTGKDCSG